MRRFRSVLALVLAAIATVLVGCSGPGKVQAPTYTSEQLAQIERYTGGVQELRDRMPELQTFIQRRQWNDVATFIHGPLGELRARMNRLARTLFSPAQRQANEAAQDLYGHLSRIDEAAKSQNAIAAAEEYRQALEDFDRFLQLVSRV